MNQSIIAILFALALIVVIASTAIVIEILGGGDREEVPMWDDATISINDAVVSVEIVSTRGERTRGLSGLSTLPEESGMLFVFPEGGRHGIWMRDMHFPIDIIWLDKWFRVVYVAEHVSPSTYPRVFRPDELSHYVLEVEAGFAETYAVTPGDQAVLQVP